MVAATLYQNGRALDSLPHVTPKGWRVLAPLVEAGMQIGLAGVGPKFLRSITNAVDHRHQNGRERVLITRLPDAA